MVCLWERGIEIIMKFEKMIRLKREEFSVELNKLSKEEMFEFLIFCNKIMNVGETFLQKLRGKSNV